MRHLFLLFSILITILSVAQKRHSPYQAFEPNAIYNLVIQLPTVDLYFDIRVAQREIDRHDWSIAGKEQIEVSKLKTWLKEHQNTGLVVTPTLLKDKTNVDYASIKLLSEYVPGLMLQPLLQGRVYNPDSRPLASQVIEYSQIVLTRTPFVAHYNFYLKGQHKPFLVTQSIGNPEEKEENESISLNIEVDNGYIDPEEQKRFTRINSFDYKSIIVDHYMAGITSQGDTVYFSWRQRPQFKGGPQKFEEFLAARVKFPESGINAGIYGALVEVSATFMKDSSVRDLVIVNGDMRFYDEAMRLIQESNGMWDPGILEGNKKGNVRCKIEILLSRPSR
ncbi:MAG: hypothetical protein K2U26_03570 [Cyclobacteriaceae bacterium]|nr:hypothetical protein [Cyclobacteriaceae bacterium]